MHLVRSAQRIAPGSPLAWSLQAEVEAAAGKDATPSAVSAGKLLHSTPLLRCALAVGVHSAGQLLPPLPVLRSYHAALAGLHEAAVLAAYTSQLVQGGGQGGGRS